MRDVKKVSDDELAKMQEGWREGTRNWILCKYEWERRLRRPDAIRSWIAICISAFALLISVISLIAKVG